MPTPETPASGRRLNLLKRRTYALALTIAGVAATVGFVLDSRTPLPTWARVVFGPGIAVMSAVMAFALNVRVLPMRTVEITGYALANGVLLLRVFTVFFISGDGLPLTDLLPDFATWMVSGFLFAFVALSTRWALTMSILLYLALLSLAVAYVVWRGPALVPGAEINLLIQNFVVSNAFMITLLYFLSRTKEELARERTERQFMSRLAHTDELTGLANRRFILQSLQRAVDRADRDEAMVSVIMFDLDRFKLVNDSYGHAMGDAVLRRASDLARENLRTSDEVGRFGGEEFLVVAFGADLDNVTMLAERLRAAFESEQGPLQPRFTASFGVASHVRGEALTSLIGRADDALYAAKTRGRNRVVRDIDLGAPPSPA